MILKKVAALLTALAITASLAGCTQPAPAPSPTPEPTPEPTPVPAVDEILFLQPGEGGWENPALNAALKSRQLALTVKKYPAAQYADKLKLLAAGGVEFDLFSGTKETGGLQKIVRAGLAAEITPPAELQGKFTEPMWRNAAVDGKTYGVPVRYREPSKFPYLIGYRAQALQNAGYESFPSEYLTDAFTAIQAAMNPESPAYTWLASGAELPLWLHRSYLSWPFSANNFMNLVKIDEEGNVSSYYESEQFKADCFTYRNFFNAGLITEAAAAGVDDGAFQAGNTLPSQGFTDQNAMGEDLAFADLGEGPAYVTSLGDTFICVSKTSKRQAAALELVEWVYTSQENYDLFHYGEAGKDYTLSEAGRIVLTAAPKAEEALTGYRPYIRYGEGISQSYIDAVTDPGVDAVLAASALFRFDDSALQEQCRLLQAAVQEYIYPIKLGLVPFDEHYDTAIEKLSLAGLREYIEEYKRQYQVFLSGAAPVQPEE